MKVRIKRQDDRRSAPYWQVFISEEREELQ